MDLTSLSLFMQTSVAYECTVCKLYFGTENQLITHHKNTHSKRLKISVNPQLSLIEDPDYTSTLYKGTSARESATNSDNNDFSNNDDKSDEELLAKRVKTEFDTDNDTVSSDDSTDKGCCSSNTTSSTVKSIDNLDPQCTDSMKSTIEKGQYGYLEGSRFHRFSLEEIKSFAVQVVALFKLDESCHESSSRVDGTANCPPSSQSLSIPVIHNDVTPLSTSFDFPRGPTGSSFQSVMRVAPDMFRGRSLYPNCMEGSSSARNADTPNASCYKCGEEGHFAWGCTNPRNPKIQPKRKTRRGKKKRGPETVN